MHLFLQMVNLCDCCAPLVKRRVRVHFHQNDDAAVLFAEAAISSVNPGTWNFCSDTVIPLKDCQTSSRFKSARKLHFL